MDGEGKFYPHLSPTSYTAQRLEHAKPSHLHLTTRRVFVGPVPVEWLKSRSSKWFKNDIKIRRTDTFTPHATVAEGRRVTMLSVPKRENTAEAEEWESESEAEADQGDSEEVEWSDAEAEQQRRRSPLVESETYMTAREHRSSSGGESDGDATERPTMEVAVLPSEPIGASLHTSDTGVESVVTGEAAAQDSLSSLLNHNKDPRTKKPAIALPSALKKNGTASGKSTMPKNTVPRTGKRKKAGAMVHFNSLAIRARPSFKARILSRRRSLRKPASKHQGEIIKTEKMLVRVEYTQSALSDDFDENETMGIETRMIEKWREFVVVCRDAGDEHENVDVKLQLYKTRKIPKSDKTEQFQIFSGKWTRQILLNRKETRCNLFSTLDKTLVIYAPYKGGHIFYILRPHSVASSVEWYTFIRDCLGWDRPSTLEVVVPDLQVTLKIASPFQEQLANVDGGGIDGTEEAQRENMNAAKSLLSRSKELLKGEKEWEEVLSYWKEHEVMGLAWRRYDRIEWVYGINEHRMYGTMGMSKTHELELRPKIHYPTETTLPDGTRMAEPPPIEGFLVRLTSASGKTSRLRQVFIRRHFFYTNNQLLFFCKPQQALPPPPPNLVGRGQAPPVNEIAEMAPLIYSVTPFALDENGGIPWLSSPAAQTVKQRDIYAYDEAERNVNNVLAADGFVDLTRIAVIRLVPKMSNPPPNTGAGDESPQEDVETEDQIFEIVMDNNLVLRLQAYNLTARDEWVDRLSALTTYWKARTADDKATIRRVRSANLSALHVDERNEAFIGQFSRKWEVGRSIASSTLHHFCSCSSCRVVTFSGPLYRKPRTHSTFRKCHVLLVHGQLLVFQDSFRTWTGTVVPHIQAERYNTLSLENCYVYSGLITESELLDRGANTATTSSATGVPGRNMLPKIYPDGFSSCDEDAMTTFVVWHGAKRSWVRTKDWQGNTVHRRVTSLGTSGNAVTFKAPCRVFRDLWVMNIAVEIERAQLMKGEELDLRS